MRRVAVTGIGTICAIGRNTSQFLASLKDGGSGIGLIQTMDCTGLSFCNGAEVSGYNHRNYFDDRRADFMDRFAQFAVIAAREAVQVAGIHWIPALREKTAIVTGSCVGGYLPKMSCSEKYIKMGTRGCIR